MIIRRTNRYHLSKLLVGILPRRLVHQTASGDRHQTSTLSQISTSTIPAADTYDIVINGGGIVGFSFLAALKCLPHLSTKRILLIEQQREPQFGPDETSEPQQYRIFSNRVSSLTGASRQLFQDLGIWPKLEPYSKRVDGMHVWSDHYTNAIHFEDTVDGQATCYIVENNRMLRGLIEQIRQQGAEVAYGTTVQEIDQVKVDHANPLCDASTSILLQLSTSKVIQTKLLIGCDGFKSLVRSRSTLPYYNFDLQQMGIVGTVQVESPFLENSVAFQRFISDRLVLALLPLSSTHSSFVLSVQAKDLPSWMELPEEEFVHRFNTEISREVRSNPVDRFASEFSKSVSGFLINKQAPFFARVPPIILDLVPGSRATFPLGFGTTVPKLIGTIQTNSFLVRDLQRKNNFANTVIMGDAAHRVHPLAGQGLNLGLGDAHELALELETHLSHGAELFGHTPDSAESLTTALSNWERTRITKLVPMLAAIHSMQTAMAWTPSALLSAFNTLPWIKSQVVAYANSR